MRLATLLLISLACVAACNQPLPPSEVNAPISPQTGQPTAPAGLYTLTGMITERTPQGDRPFSGAGVNAWVHTPTFGYSYWWAHGPQHTDSGGRYELRNLPVGTTVQLEVHYPGYVQQCAAPPFVVNADHKIDAQLVARANISASPDSVPPSASGFRLVVGTVYDAKDGRRPASDVGVDYEPYMDSPAALTFTDTQGRFLLCGIPQTRAATIAAGIGINRVVYREVPPGADAVIDIDIP